MGSRSALLIAWMGRPRRSGAVRLSPAPWASSGPASGLGGPLLEPVPGQVTAPAAERDRLRIKELQGPAGHPGLPLIPAPGAGAEPRRRGLGCRKPGRWNAASCPASPLSAWHRPWETTGEEGQAGTWGAEGRLHHILRPPNQGFLHERPQNPPVRKRRPFLRGPAALLHDQRPPIL